jgi:hypothetical protein
MHQRIVLVVLLGGIARLAWQWLDHQTASYEGGWYAYGPDGSVALSPLDSVLLTNTGLRFVTQAAFWVAWAAPSLWLLRSAPPRRDEGHAGR